MKKGFIGIWLLFLFIIVQCQSPQEQLAVNQIVSQMTLEDKARLVVGQGMTFPGLPDSLKTKFKEKVPGAAGSTHELPGVNIPSIVLADGPAGLRIAPKRDDDSTNTYYATAFPIATLLASTWDEQLIQKVGSIIGNEVLEYGVDIILMPALNLHRNPRCGRNFEYYSEDPLLSGRIAAAMVRGIQSNGVGTSIKHFAANNQETNRMGINTIVSERALRELYLKGFEIAVKTANPWTVMSSYNKINGVYASESRDLLTTILRDDWGFKGLVMTDWFAGKNPVAQMKAGNDLLMPGIPIQSKKIMKAVKADSLNEEVLNTNVKRILNIISQTPAFKKYPYSNKPDLKAHAQIARAAATEGMVLLKNDNQALPLANNKKIALFGNSSYDLVVGGTGSGDVYEAYSIPLEEGLINAGYSLDDSLKNTYVSFLDEARANQPKQKNIFSAASASANARAGKNDSTNSERRGCGVDYYQQEFREFSDRKLDDDFYLNPIEKELIQTVATAFHAKGKKVIIVLNIGGVIEVASWRDYADAILLAWQPGQEGGNAIADVLSGKVNPSGKLASTFPVVYDDVPSAKNFPGTPAEDPESVVYEEGIFVGYRYYNSFGVKTAYEFGYGLSYTGFEFGKLKLSSTTFKDRLTVKMKIKNSGKVAGKEVVQLYLSAPAEKLYKPKNELKAFVKTKLLQPGESEIISFEITARDLASFDTEQTAWVAEAGVYTIQIGSSSLNIKRTATFNLPGERIVEKLNKALSPQVEINELKN